MRKFLFGAKKASSPTPLDSRTNSDLGSPGSSSTSEPTSAHHDHHKGTHSNRNEYKPEPVRKSRHVHYDDPSETSSDSSRRQQPPPQQQQQQQPGARRPVTPVIHAQPSFDSRHGYSAQSAASNCFPLPLPRSASDSFSSGTHSAPTPQAPAPLQRDAVIGVGSDVSRTTSPLSFSPSGGAYSIRGASPYAYGVHGNASLARLADRDPTQIYAPLTWSELAHDDLVQNISPRERTRQEILWEVVASEERYVSELRSLVELYVNPLLHPLLSPPTSPPATSLYSPSPTPTPYSQSSSSPPPGSQAPLPIAARFARSDSTGSTGSGSFGHWGGPSSSERELPEIDGSESSHHDPSRPHDGSRSRASLPAPPRNPNFPTSPSSVSLAATLPDRPRGGMSSRLASLPGFRPRHPMKPPPGSAKLHKGKVPKEVLMPPPLPEGLRSVLEAIPDMLKGHEELSIRLKDQWVKAFPLVRGLALIWSDQPWFLDVYAKYILSLEEALAIIDRCLPSAHSPDKGRSGSKDDKRLARFIMDCEERASMEGEASLAIAISKPLMRLGKLPLLMQSLLYHTDATTVEYEKTRAMALEVDALVRSIEDERLEEDEREKVRDVLARIEGIKDKALMAPRSNRVLLEEAPVFPSSSSNPLTASPDNPRRAISESTSGRPAKGSAAPSGGSKKSVKRLSDLMPKGEGSKSDWFVVFSDVTIRCAKVGTTDIPGGFSREKEKQGKQGKTKKKGRTRNLYRFVKVERWEMMDASRAGLTSMEDIHRVRTSGQDTLDETSEASEEEDDDDDNFDAESRMSFTYDADDLKPAAPRNFKSDAGFGGRPRSSVSKAAGGRSVSSTTRSVVAKQTPAKAKFGARGPSLGTVIGPGGAGQRFQAPTAASIARANAPSAAGNAVRPTFAPSSRVVSPSPAPPHTHRLAVNGGKRGGSSPVPSSHAPLTLKNGGGGGTLHSRDDSTLQVYEAYWDEAAPAVPFPRR